MKRCRVRLKLTQEQERLAFQHAATARKYWNLLVEIDNANNIGTYDAFCKSQNWRTYASKTHNRDVFHLGIQEYMTLASYVASVASTSSPDEWAWFYRPNQSRIYNALAKEAVRVRNQNKGKLRFRSIRRTVPTFAVACHKSSNGKRPSRIYAKPNGRVQIPSIGDVKIGTVPETVDISCAKKSAKIIHDGKYWYLSFVYEGKPQSQSKNVTEGIGIDFGVKNLMTCSNGFVVENINKSRRVKLLERRLRRLQRRVSKKYTLNDPTKATKSANIKKMEHDIRLIYRTLKNIRKTHMQTAVSRIIQLNPEYIAIEDLDVKGLMQNRHMSKQIGDCGFYAIREQITRKAREHGIELRIVNRYYASSKTCSCCGHKNSQLRLVDREFTCDNCGAQFDRDVNASINLKNATNYTVM